MASSEKTKKLGLNLWGPDDRPERTDFVADNQALEQLVGAHIADANLHMTEGERNYLKNPCVLRTWSGNNGETRSFTLPFKPFVVLVMCSGKPGQIIEDGVLHVYSDFWTYGALVPCTYGGITVKDQMLTMSSKTNGNKVYHLNDSGCSYVAVAFPRTS